MPTKLEEIVAATRRRVANSRPTANLRDLEKRAQEHAPRGFRRALQSKARSGIAVIAELKKASPSRGLIFIVDEFQLLEARAFHADAILLIVAALSQDELVGLVIQSREYELDVLCEVHDQAELERATNAGCNLIGVNSRDLHTFQVDLDTAFQVAERMPKNIVAVAESGIHSGIDISRLKNAGYQAFLIGESLMKADSPGDALRSLITQAFPENRELGSEN